jgi:hypothetical protein
MIHIRYKAPLWYKKMALGTVMKCFISEIKLPFGISQGLVAFGLIIF